MHVHASPASSEGLMIWDDHVRFVRLERLLVEESDKRVLQPFAPLLEETLQRVSIAFEFKYCMRPLIHLLAAAAAASANANCGFLLGAGPLRLSMYDVHTIGRGLA